MKSYRKFLLGVVAVTYIFLTGFKAPEEARPAAEYQQIVNEIVAQSNDQQRNAKHQAGKIKPPSVKAKETGAGGKDEVQKRLDLSVPFKETENAALQSEQDKQNAETNIFAPDTQKKPQQLQLDGQFLKSPDPEVEKQRTVEGAGVVINIKP